MKIAAAVLSTLLLVPSALGQITIGQAAFTSAAFCLTKADAVAVAKLDSEMGSDVAFELFKANPNCGLGQAVLTVKSVVLSLPIKRGGKVSVLEVQVELGDGSKQTLFVLTDGEVHGLTNT